MKTKKLFKIILSLVLICQALFLSACGGGSDAPASTKYDGRWISMATEMDDRPIPYEEDSPDLIVLEINGSNKAKLITGSNSVNVKWTEKDGNFVMDMAGKEVIGELNDNTLKIKDMFGLGVSIIFAKEGTDAANPELYLPKEEKEVLGKWQSVEVYDALGDPVEIDINIEQVLAFEFRGNHTANIIFMNEDLGEQKWSVLGALGGSIDEYDEYTILFETMEDGRLQASISNLDFYYDVVLEKVE